MPTLGSLSRTYDLLLHLREVGTRVHNTKYFDSLLLLYLGYHKKRSESALPGIACSSVYIHI